MKNAIQDLSFSRSKDDNNSLPTGCITMQNFLHVVDQGRSSLVESDKFPIIRMMVEYEQRAEIEGMYLSAKEFLDHWKCLQKEEETRQLDIIKAKHMKDKQKISKAHEQQLLKFSQSWDQFAKDFEQKSETYLDELIQSHRDQQAHLQRTIVEEVESKPQRWSRELVDGRKREAIMADQSKYQEAQKIKSFCDALEAKEQSQKNSTLQKSLTLKERNLKTQQTAEKEALIKRIETKRREFEHKRNADIACILQRNANILAMIDSKHVSDIVLDLYSACPVR